MREKAFELAGDSWMDNPSNIIKRKSREE